MATTTRVAATTAADTTYTFNVAPGVSTSFAADDLAVGEEVTIERQTAAGGYVLLTYRGWDGAYDAKLVKGHSTITINGPVDGRINKPVTVGTVAVVEYS